MSLYKLSTSSVVEEGSSLVAENNVCSAFFKSIIFPAPPGPIPFSEQQMVSHVQTRASTAAREEARSQLKQELEKLNITEYVCKQAKILAHG